ncbi:prenyltransferase/squalene oxidase repeat-containing protein [Blastopirellula marina]|uniref:Squalene--hopene cyclase n=1 Tax=Blastopirellula marina TaxID=124 RepID=A0A2S8F864_9BACT|nr:prenyltransferase/squalene oxidase repeat-containing protein [Blastopirellula marina]PQO28337.1 squalene--hopene cyclase [Blastopirellula marina]PTL41877.1 squalene--hopene cyclase [Blastopirellula marina]
MIDPARIRAAYEIAKQDLLNQRDPSGHWIGQLSTSSLSTATAVSALQLVLRNSSQNSDADAALIRGGVDYLLSHQNEDGGWGDTDLSYSNIATTMLSVAALTLTGDAEKNPSVLSAANRYIEQKGGIPGLRARYGKDKTFAVPILTNYALAGLVDWKEVAPLPFEAAVLPQSFYKFIQLPVVSYAIPALVGIGQAKYYHDKPWNPLLRLIRGATFNPAAKVLTKMQPESGGYLEAIPLTSFVVMSLAATGRADSEVARNGLRFIRESVRPDGSWPIDTNLATWVTTLSINALSVLEDDNAHLSRDSLEWLLDCQTKDIHPFTGAAPGAWGWTDLSGSVPDADDTPGALLALRHFHDRGNFDDATRQRIRAAAQNGCRWLFDLQNSDGGWPTFCRGWGTQPFDRSGSDLTAHALRGLFAWFDELDPREYPKLIKGKWYLFDRQSAGSWLPLWFGNQDRAEEDNPIYGTAKVLNYFRDTHEIEYQLKTPSPPSIVPKNAIRWLAAQQNEDGGFGGGKSVLTGTQGRYESTVEETALAIEGLLCDDKGLENHPELDRALDWLCHRVEENSHIECSPIGFYFSKLWYYEKLYPRILTVSALAYACKAAQVSASGNVLSGSGIRESS